MTVVVAGSRASLLVRGVAALVFGVLTLIWPGISLHVLVLLFGAFVLVDGVFLLLAVLSGSGEPGWHGAVLIVEALAGIAAGVVTLVWPGLTALALLYLIAAWALVTGALKLAVAAWYREIPHRWLLGLSGALSVAFGVVLIAAPVAGALAITWLIGWWAIVWAAVLLAIAWHVHRVRDSLERLVEQSRHVVA
jgi:uncharacterized membrane protein HdeD (DUF308 family)